MWRTREKGRGESESQKMRIFDWTTKRRGDDDWTRSELTTYLAKKKKLGNFVEAR